MHHFSNSGPPEGKITRSSQKLIKKVVCGRVLIAEEACRYICGTFVFGLTPRELLLLCPFALGDGGIEVEDELGVVEEFLAVDCGAGKLEFLLQCESFVSAYRPTARAARRAVMVEKCIIITNPKPTGELQDLA